MYQAMANPLTPTMVHRLLMHEAEGVDGHGLNRGERERERRAGREERKGTPYIQSAN